MIAWYVASWAASDKLSGTEVKRTSYCPSTMGLRKPAALQHLADLPRSTVRVASPEVVRIGGLAPRNAFHPKLYLFDAVAETGYVVGSANLTESALISNTEVVAAGKEALVAGTWDDVWTAVAAETSPLTAQLLDAYRDARTRPDRPALEPERLRRPQALRRVNRLYSARPSVAVWFQAIYTFLD